MGFGCRLGSLSTTVSSIFHLSPLFALKPPSLTLRLVCSGGDFLGRTLPTFLPLISSQPSLLSLALLRIAFIPFFLLTSSASSTVPDGIFLLGLGLLGISNGFVAFVPSPSSLPRFFPSFFRSHQANASSFTRLSLFSTNALILSSSPALNPNIEPEEREVASVVAIFILVGGLVGGSAASFGLLALKGA